MAATDEFTSIPALLARNARIHAAKPAWREKEFGIWQRQGPVIPFEK